MRLIDADDLKKTWYKEHNIEPGESGAMFVGNNEVPKFVDRARTIDPVWHGRWIEHYKSDAPPTLKERWICSWCGNVQTYGATDYCPNCGARMDGENDEID